MTEIIDKKTGIVRAAMALPLDERPALLKMLIEAFIGEYDNEIERKESELTVIKNGRDGILETLSRSMPSTAKCPEPDEIADKDEFRRRWETTLKK